MLSGSEESTIAFFSFKSSTNLMNSHHNIVRWLVVFFIALPHFNYILKTKFEARKCLSRRTLF